MQNQVIYSVAYSIHTYVDPSLAFRTEGCLKKNIIIQSKEKEWKVCEQNSVCVVLVV